MGRLTNDEFLVSVSQLLKESNGESSVYLTQKRLSEPEVERSEPLSDVSRLSSSKPVIYQPVLSDKTYSILLRATNGESKDKGKKKKYSTVIDSSNLDKFWLDYVNVLKNGMVGLKKKDKKSKKSKKKVTK